MKPDYARLIMKLHDRKAAITAFWVLAVLLAAVLSNLMSSSSWVMVAVLAAVPPMILWHFWNAPVPSMSESIRKAKD